MKISNFIVFLGACVLASTVSLRAEVISNVVTNDCSTEQTEHPKLHGKFKERMLKKYDKNHDGKLDDAEKAAMKADRAERKEKRHKEMLEKYDANKDGKLDDAEKAVMKKEMKEKREKRHAEKVEKLKEKKEEKVEREEVRETTQEVPLEKTEAVKTQPTPVSDLGPQTPIPTFPVRGSQ